MQVHAASGVNVVRLRNLEDNNEATRKHTNILQRELTASLTKVREL